MSLLDQLDELDALDAADDQAVARPLRPRPARRTTLIRIRTRNTVQPTTRTQIPTHQYGAADDAYPDTDAQYGAADDAYPNTDDQYGAADDAYPDTDAQYGAADDAYPDTSAQYAADDAYPDTDAQYGAADDAYPDTDAQYGAAEYPDPAPPAPAPAAAPPPPPEPAAPPAAAPWRPPDWSKPPVMHKPRLEKREAGEPTRSMSLGGSRAFIVGRNGQVADIVVEEASLSRAHAAIINSSSATFVQDLGSAHGTWLDAEGRRTHVPQLGERLGAEPVKLVEGVTLRFGQSKIVFSVAGLSPDVVAKWAPPPWAEALKAPGRLEVRAPTKKVNPYLAHAEGDAAAAADADEVVELAGRATVLGRTAALVDVVVRDESVSRQHCALVNAEDATFVHDLNSATGTFVDGFRATAGFTRLHDGAVIMVGNCATEYTYRVGVASKGEGGAKKKQRR